MFDRHPDLQMVSVESGVGWIPFILETLDYEMSENAPDELAKLKKMPSEYFRSNLYATFWFENNRNKLPDLIEAVGEDSILFETDFPHPTCLYPNPLETVEEKMATLAPETRKQDLRRERPQALPALKRRRRARRGHHRTLDRRPTPSPARRGARGPVYDPARGVQTARGRARVGRRGRRRRQGRGRGRGRVGRARR